MQNILNTIFIDMDGVTTDFDKQFEKIVGVAPQFANRNDHYKNFSKFVREKGFQNAPLMPNAKTLIKSLVDISREHNVRLQYLTSDGSMREFRSQVMLQKMNWLHKHGLWLGEGNFLLSHGWRGKSDHASALTLLIDDTDRNVQHFTEHGGNAVLYKDADCAKIMKAIQDVLSN